MQLFNNATQKNEDVKWSVDRNDELVATFSDKGFVKFPSGTTKAELQKLAKRYEEVNKGKEIITPEEEAKREEQRKASEELVKQLNKE